MIIDLQDYHPGDDLDCDLCIAGGGAAGLAIALEFLYRPQSVLVLEGGGLDYSSDSQAIYQGEIVGHEYLDLDRTRLRYLGGSTNHWGGWCRPLDAIAFETRPWVADSGWPIDESVLAPYVGRAHDFLGMGPPRYGADAVAGLLQAPLLALDPDLFGTRVWNEGQPAPHVGELHQATLHAAANPTVLLNANVRDVIVGDSGERVLAVGVEDRDGRRRRVGARHFVLALGGLENPRLLLNANARMPAGVGNGHDLVGRFFMEHLEFPTGLLAMPDPGRVATAYHPTLLPNARYQLRPGIGLNPAVQRAEGTLDHTFNIRALTARNASSGYVALRRTVLDLRRGRMPDLAEHLPEILGDLGGALGGTYRELRGVSKLEAIEVHSHGEQTPNPESRVFLTDAVDRLGLRRIALDWRPTSIDKRSCRRAALLLASEIGRTGVGRLQLPEWLLDEGRDDWGGELRGGNHHMGTTRMADDPRRGVVDSDCRVFGSDNLHIAGSSAFPTGGSANPTLTIIQLALRLADRLHTLL